MNMNTLAPAVRPSSVAPAVWPWWALALTYYAIGCLMHLRFSIWLVSQRSTWFGNMAYADLVPGLAITAATVLVFWLIFRLQGSPRPGLTLGYWLLWVAALVLIDRYLTYSTNEYAHYPQYAMLAWLLARAMDPQRTRWYVGRVLCWTTLLGMGDELLQYLWITTSYSEYLDFNDFLTNLVAAAAGMLLYYGPVATTPGTAKRRKPGVEWLAVIFIAVLVLIGFQSGSMATSPPGPVPPGGIAQLADGSRRLYLQRAPELYGSWASGPRHGRYFVLPPMPALLIMALAGLAFSSYRRLRTPSTGPT